LRIGDFSGEATFKGRSSAIKAVVPMRAGPAISSPTPAGVLLAPVCSTAQPLVRNLEPALKEDSMMPLSAGLGSAIAALFADAALELPIPEWQGEGPQAAFLEP
jgi:hypothetical protein